MIEADIEAKLVAAVRSKLAGAAVYGFWVAPEEGRPVVVAPPFVAVHAQPKYPEFEGSRIFFSEVSILARTAYEADKDGAVIRAYGAGLSELLDGWSGGSVSAKRAALRAELGGADYTVNGIIDAARGCGFDYDKEFWFFTKTIILRFNMTA